MQNILAVSDSPDDATLSETTIMRARWLVTGHVLNGLGQQQFMTNSELEPKTTKRYLPGLVADCVQRLSQAATS